ncbi:hypothetical protein [Helicobacter apodemus]|uniref:Uncharacterized protein n=1 Tax=Helicobacter apodemus TaxID=135569 RepID=A0A2U8FF65_9HELI|nr:hypothetical protein [Helicobacter apodemus]AWI34793.1 hypothetical protein CDV25_08475 [Helicobacter apodemus]
MQIHSNIYQPLILQTNTRIDYETHPHNQIFEDLSKSAPAGAEIYGIYRPNSLATAMNYLLFPGMLEDTLVLKNTSQLSHQTSNGFGGYSVDEYGFMGEEFLKAANLPNEYKIHKNALQAFNDFYTTPDFIDSKTTPQAQFEAIDLIAGLSYAYKEIQSLTQGKFDSKEAYSEDEIKHMFKDSFEKFSFNFGFNTPLMQDYKNEKGEFKKEGIMLSYAFVMDTFAKAESPFTKLSEYGKFLRGMPSSYSPNKEDTTKKPKTPEELKKEMLNQLDEVYLKILENTQETQSDLKPIIAKNNLKEIDELINKMIRKVRINDEAS